MRALVVFVARHGVVVVGIAALEVLCQPRIMPGLLLRNRTGLAGVQFVEGLGRPLLVRHQIVAGRRILAVDRAGLLRVRVVPCVAGVLLGGQIVARAMVLRVDVLGLLLRRVNPTYPPLARTARIQGKVLLQAQISKSGDIQNLQVISGHPMLIQSALDAVKQWKYRPYLLNGEAVEVDTTIEVNFTLAGG